MKLNFIKNPLRQIISCTRNKLKILFNKIKICRQCKNKTLYQI